jgi:hypothetical protein
MSLLDSYLYPAFFLSLLGLALFVYGRKAPSLIAGIGGIALMIEPCVLFSAHLLWIVGVLTAAATIMSLAVLQKRAFDPTI